ncbi:OVARIAN TUMOR DOMAIN-containing deubiquitinating enzyme 7 isoform X6 [Magnolia sinica]|uniref:OVARIAN TUMOR DOMAIN-containing deubiquitinating enzyme 7 isoform X6 n=1 Tax=Magnolia sinica TaxID=86752 RepID=UPI00265A7448|nr:OVARIAN TUMOR DOMAIN-containing deubiquitinating enzyme 7 isoform X6 [Magnolia sinica]
MSFGRQVKKHGKPANIAQFHPQLDSLGLKIIQVTADGNCFFRALADQLEGNEEEHGKYRHMVVQYIMKHRQEFEPFIEDDVPFDEYCKSMEKDGTWAGNMELQAASLVTRSNICIHRVMSPRWYIRNFDSRGTCMIHLSYHDGEHYNSIRLKEDPGNGPARQIVIKVLQELDGDIDAAIETLRAGVGTDEDLVEHDEFPDENVANNGHYENGDYEDPEAPQQSKIPDPNRASDDLQIHDDDSSQPDDKKIPRNKACPCGSKKKYKACCGTRTRKSSPEPVITEVVQILSNMLLFTRTARVTHGRVEMVETCQHGTLYEIWAIQQVGAAVNMPCSKNQSSPVIRWATCMRSMEGWEKHDRRSIFNIHALPT